MSWIIVNFFNDSDFEHYDVDFSQRKRTSWIRTAIKTLSYLSYVPTTVSLAKFLMQSK